MIITLTGTERRIRPLRHADLETLIAWDNDPELQHLTGRRLGDDEQVTQWWQSIERDRSRLAAAIIDDDGGLIGDTELENVTWRAGEAELRISIGDKRAWNRGYGTEALQEMARLAFTQMGLRSLYLRVSDENVRAIRSYRKVGFRKVGRLSATGRLRGSQSLVLMRMNAKSGTYGVIESAVTAGALSTARM